MTAQIIRLADCRLKSYERTRCEEAGGERVHHLPSRPLTLLAINDERRQAGIAQPLW